MEENIIHCRSRLVKKMSVLACMVAILFAGSVNAQLSACQTYTCGTSTANTTYESPLNNYYYYSFTEMLFLANELSGEAGTIYKIGFQYANATAMTSKTNVTIYMKNVTQTAFADGTSWITNGLTQVYSGSLNCSQGWNDFTLTTPFNYTGGNLLVVVDDNSNGYNGSSYTFYYTATTGNTVIRTQSDSYHYTLTGSNLVSNQTGGYGKNRVNTRFCITENCDNHRSGSFTFGTTTDFDYVIGSGAFTAPSLTNTLNPAGTVTYSSSNTAVATVNATTGAVTFTGIEGTVTITAVSESGSYCKEYASYTIHVGDGCRIIGEGTSTTTSAPLATFYKNSYEQMIYTLADVGSAGIISSIGFQSAGTNTVSRQVDIYMGETNQASFAATTSWVPAANLTLVYSGTWNIVPGWNMFPVDFLYTGTGNLVIAVDCGATTYSSSNFYSTSTTDYTTLYAYSDSYDAVPSTIGSYQGTTDRLQCRPNTKICIDPCSVRPTFEYENTMAMCYLGNNCPMLPLDNSSNGEVTYWSEDETIATVDANGVITTLALGETTIHASLALDGETCPAKAEYVLQVICPALIPSASSISLCQGDNVTLTASTSGGGVLQWFDDVASLTPIASGEEYSATVNHSVTYFVATYNEEYDCYSSRVPAYVNVFNVEYPSTTQSISGYVGVTMYGYPPEEAPSGTVFTQSGMPAWMTLNSDGSFSGTPSAAGSGTFTITATYGECSKQVTISWNVTTNNLSCCDPEAFYIFKQGNSLPIQLSDDGYYYIDVCKDESATFTIQKLASCTGYSYNWRLASSTGGLLTEGTGTSFTYTYDRAMGYNLTLTVSKTGSSAGCPVSLPIRIRVAGMFQVATRPSFDLCKGEPFNIYVSSDGIGSVDVVRPNGGSASTLGVTDTVFIPDGVPCNGTCFFRSSVTFADFSSDAVIRDANDLLYVMLNMEHSFAGDIYIALTCPNGSRAVILPQSGNGSATCHDSIPTGYSTWQGDYYSTGIDFGISGSGYSTDCGAAGTIGEGWNYIWSNNTTRGYGYAGGTYGYIYESENVGHDNSGSIDSSHFEDMTQVYHPYESFDNMIGCPLNGTWSIEVVDGWSVDDGHIFHWELGLNEELLPDSWTYTVDIDSAWVDCGWPTSKAGVYMEITPPDNFVGTTSCDLYLRDEYGCVSQYDNIVTVTMNNTESSTTEVGPQCEPYYWSISGQTYDTSGEYVEQGLTEHGCPKRDTLILSVDGAKYDTITAQACQQYTWDVNGQTYTSSGTYDATLVSYMGCDSILTLILEILPELTTEKDTAVCPITYPFNWYNSDFTAAGTQTQNLTTADGCDSIVTLTVTTLPKPEVSLTAPADDCPLAVGENYTVTTTVTNGTADYSYEWTGDYTGTDANATIPGTGTCGSFSVEVIVTDDNGCKDTANVTFNSVDSEAPTFANPITSTPALLSGAGCVYLVPDLTSTVQPQDNCQISSVEQSPVANTTITEETDVTITVKDQCEGVSTHTVHLTIPEPITADIDNTNVACNGGNNGLVWVYNVAGGNGEYHYTWSTTDGNTTNLNDNDTIFNRTAGTYNVVISDANGCTLEKTATVSEAGDLVSTLTPTAVQCYQTATGSIVIDSVVGGTPGYTYNWSTGSHSDSGLDNLMPGTYSLTIIDNEGCSITVYATVEDKEELIITPADSLNVDCNGNSTGSLAVTAIGGVEPYQYVLSNTDTNSTGSFTNLPAGAYYIQVVDAMGCKDTTRITIEQPEALAVTELTTAHHDVQCFGGTDGAFTLTASNGTPEYTFAIDGTSISNTTGVFGESLSADTYNITVTDANGCSVSTTVDITEPNELKLLEVESSHVDIACSGGNNGQLQVSATGGTTIYTYSLGGDFNTTGLFQNLVTGTYTVTVTDAHFCDTTLDIYISTLSPMSIQETYHQDVNCYGETNGQFTVVASGGTNNFTYSINGGAAQTECNFTGAAGTYYIKATDDNDCFIWDTVVITQPDTLVLLETTSLHHDVDCFGNSTGGATVVATGGTTTYSYELNGATNQTGVFNNQLTQGSYTATVTDAHGCTATTPIMITQPPLLTISATHQDLRCKLDGTGSIDLSVAGGKQPYSYVWSIPGNNSYATTQDLNGIQAETYSVVVTDYNGCTHDTSIVVTQPEGMTLTMSQPQTICLYESADIWVSVVDGTRPYSFHWSNNATDSALTVTPSVTTTYTVTVTDNNDCDMTDNVTITVNMPSTGIDNQRACDSYVWPTNGAEYFESTNAPMVNTLTNAVGCDSTAILHLVIVYSTEGIDYQEHCDKYGWPHNGMTYTESTNEPTAVLHGANSVGCDSTVTLNLIINNSTAVHDTNVAICENDDPYRWNGANYDATGTYSITLRTVHDCDSIVSFTLTVHDTNHTYIYDTCMVKDLPWEWGGRSYPTPITDDLFYYTNVYGCDSTVHYNLEAIFDCSEFLQFPSVVTPNGDGLNDVFHIVGLIEEACYPLNRLSIYNRWGAKVFEAENIDEESDFWDPAAERAPAGTYYYRFDGDGFKGHVERKGVVEVVR